MTIISDTLPFVITLFENPIMFSLLGLVGLAIVIASVKILSN